MSFESATVFGRFLSFFFLSPDRTKKNVQELQVQVEFISSSNLALPTLSF